MKVGLMQPYLFPYIGYFQLITAVDKFIIYDDVQYIKGGWINRNRILANNKDHLFTFSLKKDNTKLNIHKRYFAKSFFNDKAKFLKTLKENYGKTENFKEIYNIIENALDVNPEEHNISLIITRSLKLICDYLGIKTPIFLSSEIEKDDSLKGEDRVIEINKKVLSTHYINPIGGRELYSKENFMANSLKLNFLKSKSIVYEQKTNEFAPWLSIIDVLMFNDKAQVQEFLNDYELI